MDRHASGCLHDDRVSVCCHDASGSREGGGSDEAETVARARRLIQAKDHATAVTMLEDLLIESEVKDPGAIIAHLGTVVSRARARGQGRGTRE